MRDITENNETSRSMSETRLGASFWLISSIVALAYGGIFPFVNISTGFLSNTFLKGDSITAGRYLSIFLLTSALLVPSFGIMTDKIGKRTYLMFISGILGVLAYGFLYSSLPLIAFIVLGISYSLFAAVIWPSLSVVLKPEVYVSTSF